MGGHILDQGLDGIDTNGPLDLQPGRTPVSPMGASSCDVYAYSIYDRFTWGIEMTCKTAWCADFMDGTSQAKNYDRWHSLPATTRPDQKSHILGVDRRTALRSHNAAGGGGLSG